MGGRGLESLPLLHKSSVLSTPCATGLDGEDGIFDGHSPIFEWGARSVESNAAQIRPGRTVSLVLPPFLKRDTH